MSTRTIHGEEIEFRHFGYNEDIEHEVRRFLEEHKDTWHEKLQAARDYGEAHFKVGDREYTVEHHHTGTVVRPRGTGY